MEKIQIDLIDFSAHQTSDGFRYVVHMKCHVSKYTWAEGLKSKVALFHLPFLTKCMKKRRIPYFSNLCKLCKFCSLESHRRRAVCTSNFLCVLGPCKVLQSDNGGEFVGSDFKAMLTEEFPVTKQIFNLPRHPQTTGLIERANSTLEQRVGSWIQKNGAEGWNNALSMLVHEINTQPSHTIGGLTPFEMLFAKKHHPRMQILPDEEYERVLRNDCEEEEAADDDGVELSDSEQQDDANSSDPVRESMIQNPAFKFVSLLI